MCPLPQPLALLSRGQIIQNGLRIIRVQCPWITPVHTLQINTTGERMAASAPAAVNILLRGPEFLATWRHYPVGCHSLRLSCVGSTPHFAPEVLLNFSMD
jgi:hypothetical protein